MTERVWVYTLVRNEALLMPYFVRHYLAFCERVIVYDDASDDETADLARAGGAEVRPYPGNGHLDDLAFVQFAEATYPEARGQADWVVWVDGDEFVYHRRIAERLAELRACGVRLPRTEGWSMMAQEPPTGPGQIWELISRGVPAPAYAKVAVFDPTLDISWAAGKHTADVAGGVSTDDGRADPLKLLHYRYLGGAYFRERNQRNYERIDARNRGAWHGRECYPDYVGEYSPAWYEGRLELAQVVV